MVILTQKDGKEIGDILNFEELDVDLTETKDFEFSIPVTEYSSQFEYGSRIFVPNTEFGGIIGTKENDTKAGVVIFKGRNWRGMLDKKIIVPPAGADYKVVSGELNSILRSLIQEAGLQNLFHVPYTDTGINITSFQFNRYCTLYDGIEKLLLKAPDYSAAGVGYKMDLMYVQQNNIAGYIKLEAKPIVDYSSQIELSQDSQLNFRVSQSRRNVNHLICLGQGELRQRTVIHLYTDEKGNISNTQVLFGEDEVVEIYENAGVETANALREEGIAKLLELTNGEAFEMDAASLAIDVAVGDKIGGRDYITGIVCSDFITNKVYKLQRNAIAIDYKIGGEKKDEVIIE